MNVGLMNRKSQPQFPQFHLAPLGLFPIWAEPTLVVNSLTLGVEPPAKLTGELASVPGLES